MLQEEGRGEGHDLGVTETQAALKAQVPRYAGFTVPRFGMRLLNRLGLKPHPTCGRQSTCTIPLPSGKMPPSSEVRDAPKEAETASPRAALAITSSKESAKESDPSGAAETDEG